MLHSERSLRGALFVPGDFFSDPRSFQSSSRHAYRNQPRAARLPPRYSDQLAGPGLGCTSNDKILRPYLRRAWLRSACVLAVFLAEHLLFEVSTYMVDLLALPLLLEATYQTLRADQDTSQRSQVFHVSLLLGISTAFKITNLAVALPLMLFWAYRLWKQGRLTKQLKNGALALLILVLPLLPFWIYIYRITGNPFFPSAIFSSSHRIGPLMVVGTIVGVKEFGKQSFGPFLLFFIRKDIPNSRFIPDASRLESLLRSSVIFSPGKLGTFAGSVSFCSEAPGSGALQRLATAGTDCMRKCWLERSRWRWPRYCSHTVRRGLGRE